MQSFSDLLAVAARLNTIAVGRHVQCCCEEDEEAEYAVQMAKVVSNPIR